jgi:hypothetical protein
MRRFILLLVVVTASAVMVSQASANTTQFVTMTLAEPIHPQLSCPGFPDHAACGRGEVIPFGQASETIVFPPGCDNCGVRTITLGSGSLILDEDGTSSLDTSPGQSFLELARTNVTDVVVGGTGIFEGATGTLTGTVSAEFSNVLPAGTVIIKLSGTIHYDP